MTGLDEHREECVGDVVSQHRSKPAISGGTANHRFRATEERDQVQVEILAREGEREPAGAKVFLGTEVVAGEGERRLGRGADEGKVDDSPDPGGSRSVGPSRSLRSPRSPAQRTGGASGKRRFSR